MNDSELRMREQAEKLAQYQSTLTPTGLAGNSANGCDEPMREVLRHRLANRLGRARREQFKVSALDELTYLLDKNPDVARILELIEICGV